jgi:hypothetical protein
MKIPAGFLGSGKTISEEDRKKYAPKLEKNLYRQNKQEEYGNCILKRT